MRYTVHRTAGPQYNAVSMRYSLEYTDYSATYSASSFCPQATGISEMPAQFMTRKNNQHMQD